MLNKKAIEEYNRQLAPKRIVSNVKPVVKPTVANTKSDRNTPIKLIEQTKEQQIASLEAQLAALKSLSVSTSKEKVS